MSGNSTRSQTSSSTTSVDDDCGTTTCHHVSSLRRNTGLRKIPSTNAFFLSNFPPVRRSPFRSLSVLLFLCIVSYCLCQPLDRTREKGCLNGKGFGVFEVRSKRGAGAAFPPTSSACATVSSTLQCLGIPALLRPPHAGFRARILLSTRTPQFARCHDLQSHPAPLYTSGTSRAVQPIQQRADLRPSRPTVAHFNPLTRTKPQGVRHFAREPTRPNSAAEVLTIRRRRGQPALRLGE